MIVAFTVVTSSNHQFFNTSVLIYSLYFFTHFLNKILDSHIAKEYMEKLDFKQKIYFILNQAFFGKDSYFYKILS